MSRKSQIARLDKLWSQKVIERDKGICQYCRKPGDNPHHIIPRRYMALRHDLKNGICLCTQCHAEIAHGQPESFRGWVMDRLGDGYWTLLRKSQEIKIDLDEVERKLKEYLR